MTQDPQPKTGQTELDHLRHLGKCGSGSCLIQALTAGVEPGWSRRDGAMERWGEMEREWRLAEKAEKAEKAESGRGGEGGCGMPINGSFTATTTRSTQRPCLSVSPPQTRSHARVQVTPCTTLQPVISLRCHFSQVSFLYGVISQGAVVVKRVECGMNREW